MIPLQTNSANFNNVGIGGTLKLKAAAHFSLYQSNISLILHAAQIKLIFSNPINYTEKSLCHLKYRYHYDLYILFVCTVSVSEQSV
jgi:hypothetical protein